MHFKKKNLNYDAYINLYKIKEVGDKNNVLKRNLSCINSLELKNRNTDHSIGNEKNSVIIRKKHIKLNAIITPRDIESSSKLIRKKGSKEYYIIQVQFSIIIKITANTLLFKIILINLPINMVQQLQLIIISKMSQKQLIIIIIYILQKYFVISINLYQIILKKKIIVKKLKKKIKM